MAASNNAIGTAGPPAGRWAWFGATLLRHELLLLVIVVVGLALRVNNLAAESIWYDEGYSIRIAQLPIDVMLGTVAREDNNPPLYYLLLHGWLNVFGSSETAARGLSVLFGTVSIAAIYLIGQQLFDRRVGTLSALLLTVAELHVQYSQETRAYNLLAMLGLLSLLCFVLLLRSGKPLAYLAYLVCSALLLYTHIFGATLVLVQNVYVVIVLLMQPRQRWATLLRWAGVQTLLLLAFAPYLAALLGRVKSVQAGFWLARPTPVTALRTLAEFAGSAPLLLLVVAVLGLAAASWLWAVRSAGWRAAFVAGSQTPSVPPLVLLLLWLLLPLVGAFVLSQFSTPIFLTRYLIGSSVALYLLVAVALVRLFAQRALAVAALAMLLLVAGVELHQYYSTPAKEPWREVVSYVETQAGADDLLLFHGANAQLNGFDYYAERADLAKLGVSRVLGAEYLATLLPQVEQYQRVWLVLSHGHRSDQLLPPLLERYEVAEHRSYIGIETYYLERRAP